ncbi:hypothetical protein WMY93_004198 [Mugilogobius chulae]|uniref:Gypsy retrotransposon integrase-like protein 1 n=1 Tax=Mugilogobius chulae TaxID=88201 RepID=A0AAW0PN17_9GOBI
MLDNSVITKLQLEQKKDNPPPFPELLLSLRTEEDRQIVKESLMKKHIGSSKSRVSLQSQSACSCANSKTEVDTLALVVPDVKHSHPLVLIGTNTMDIAYRKCMEASSVDHQLAAFGYQAVLKILQHRHAQSSNIQPALLTLSSNQPEIILPAPVQLWRLAFDTTVRERITSKLNSIPDVFAKHDLDFGRTDKVKHQIKLSDPTPFKQRPRPIHPQDVDAVRNHLRELLESGVIRDSDSPFASPIVVVRKKNGSVRLCIDYRKLNMQTIKDAYALPKLEDAFTALSGSKWFTVLDLKSGYYQIEMDEDDKTKTAFVVRLVSTSLIACHKESQMPPARFNDSWKSVWAGVQTDPDKIEALKTWPVPTTLKELRSFLGFAGYYRRFVQDYSTIVKPLHDLTAGYPPSQKKFKATVQPGNYLNPKEPFGGRWTQCCQQAFNNIIAKLTSAPVLAFADPHKPYVLHTDASSTGLGAILYQEHDGKNRVVAYASRGLSRSESNYPAHKLEFLALKWAVTEKFNDYLYGAQFTVVTDSNLLTYLLSSAKLDATSYRWLSSLSTFTFKIVYRAGRQNADADGLSRRPHPELPDDPASSKEHERVLKFVQCHLDQPVDTDIDYPIVQAICDRQLVCGSPSIDPVHALVLSLSANPECLPDSFTDDTQFASPVLPQYSPADLVTKQRSDPIIRHVIAQLERGDSPPPTLRDELPELPLLLREVNKMELQNNLLVRRRQLGSHITYQLVLPEECRAAVLSQLHDQMGHLGIERTLDLVRSRFFWPRMSADVHAKIRSCERCVKRKALPVRAATLVNIKTTRPLELVCIDFLSLEPDRRVKDILVITDHFTKYAVAVPTPNQKARTVAKCLWEDFFIHYGIPERLHSDQGPDFESRTIKELCDIAGIHKGRTTPYHPRGNPVERFNRTLLNMLGTLTAEKKSHWRDFVKPLVHAYNCTKNDVTGFSPYELMFGRQPRLPVDLAFGLPLKKNIQTSHSQYVQDLKNHLKESYQLAMLNSERVMSRNKDLFDRHVSPSALAIGDRVLVRNVRLRGKQKLADKWESDVYVVVKKAGNLPVYTVRPESQAKPLRTLHRDLLLPCGYLPASGRLESVKMKTHVNLSDPDPEVDEQDLSDDENFTFADPLLVEPVKFVKTIVKPTASMPLPEISHPGIPLVQPFVSKDDSPVMREDRESSAISAEPLVMEEVQSIVDSVPTQPDTTGPADASEDEVNPSSEICVSEVSNDHANLDSSEEPESSRQEATLSPRRSTRQRTAPDRLQYTKPGNPLLKSIQSLFHGLNTVFSYVLEEDGDRDVSKLPYTSPPIISNQPGPCPRTFMGSGGEDVTHVE